MNNDDTHKINIYGETRQKALPVADMFCNRISNVPPNPSAHSNTDPARLGVCCAKLIAPVFVVDRAVAAAIAAVVTSSFAAIAVWVLGCFFWESGSLSYRMYDMYIHTKTNKASKQTAKAWNVDE